MIYTDCVLGELIYADTVEVLSRGNAGCNKGLEKVEQELTTSENDGPVSEIFRKVTTTAASL